MNTGTVQERIRQSSSNVILSADMSTVGEICSMIEKLKGDILGVKFHSDCIEDLTVENEEKMYGLCQKYDLLVIEDRKFCDIGNTVKTQAVKIVKYADLITVHAIPGEGILQGLEDLCMKSNCRILLLAQMSSKGCLIDDNYTREVVKMAKKYRHIVAGFICQEFLCEGFLHFTPGVKLRGSTDDLGQQYNTPEYLINRNKVDVLIVGRGLYSSSEPEKEVKKYNMKNQLNHIPDSHFIKKKFT